MGPIRESLFMVQKTETSGSSEVKPQLSTRLCCDMASRPGRIFKGNELDDKSHGYATIVNQVARHAFLYE